MFKPLLAPLNSPNDTPTFFQDIQFPVLASPKYDGIRALVRKSDVIDYTSLDGEVVGSKISVLSRTLTELPSIHVQRVFGNIDLLNFDGELVAGDPTAPNAYNLTNSLVMSADKPGKLTYYVFDITDEHLAHEPYFTRLDILDERFHWVSPNIPIFKVPQINCDTLEELLAFETECLEEGYEGVMFRNPIGIYKHNRATYKENIIYKLKRFTDVELAILDFEEAYTNNNILEVDARGYAKRSQSKENLIPANTLGKFICDWNCIHLKVAPGTFTHSERQWIWNNKELVRGRLLKTRFFGYGMKDVPRFARATGFRSKIDM